MTACPSLTGLTASTTIITKELVDDLIVSTYSRTVGTTVTVKCRDDFGFNLVGPSTVTCQANGAWTGSPYCSTTPVGGTTNSNTTGLDDQKILIIVLVVVGVVVAALILFVCIAMFWGRKRHRRQKRYKYDDDDSSVTYSTHREMHLQQYPSHVTPAFNARKYDYYQPRYPTTYMEETALEPRWFDDPYYTQSPPARVIPLRASHQPRVFGSMRHSRSMDNLYDEFGRRMADEDYHDRLTTENVRVGWERR